MWYEDAVRWAREGIEWLRGDRRIDSPAGPKATENCHQDAGQAAPGTRKTGNPPPGSDFVHRPYMLMNLGQRD
jgi:hypothetical protein